MMNVEQELRRVLESTQHRCKSARKLLFKMIFILNYKVDLANSTTKASIEI